MITVHSFNTTIYDNDMIMCKIWTMIHKWVKYERTEYEWMIYDWTIYDEMICERILIDEWYMILFTWL